MRNEFEIEQSHLQVVQLSIFYTFIVCLFFFLYTPTSGYWCNRPRHTCFFCMQQTVIQKLYQLLFFRFASVKLNLSILKIWSYSLKAHGWGSEALHAAWLHWPPRPIQRHT